MAVPPDPNRSSVAAGPIGGGRRKGLLVLLLALVAAAVLLALLLSAGDDDGEDASRPAQTATQSVATGAAEPATAGNTAAPAAGAGAATGTLVAGTTSLLGADASGIAQQLDENAEGRGLQVLSISENGFFVGTGPEDRQYVEFGGKVGEDEPDSVRPAVGTKVDLTGPVREAPQDPAKTLKLDGDGARAVEERGAYINADTVTESGG